VPLASVGTRVSVEREKIPSFLDDRRSPDACLLRPPSSRHHSPNVGHPWPGRHPSLPSPSPSSRATLSLPNTGESAKGAGEGGASPAGRQRGWRKRDFSLSETGRVFYVIRGRVGAAGTSAVMCAAGEEKSRFSMSFPPNLLPKKYTCGSDIRGTVDPISLFIVQIDNN
jgi:hypothetical protein